MSCYYGHPAFEANCTYCREEQYKTRSKVELLIEELDVVMDDLDSQLTKVKVLVASLKHERNVAGL